MGSNLSRRGSAQRRSPSLPPLSPPAMQPSMAPISTPIVRPAAEESCESLPPAPMSTTRFFAGALTQEWRERLQLG